MGLTKYPNEWTPFGFYVPPPAPLQVIEKKQQITINIQSLVGKVVINSERDIDVMKEKVIAALQDVIKLYDGHKI